MKKQIQPFPNLEILIQTNGSTYNDGANLKIPPILASAQNSVYKKMQQGNISINTKSSNKEKYDKDVTFYLKKKHRDKLLSLSKDSKQTQLSLETYFCIHSLNKVIYENKKNLAYYSKLSFPTKKMKPLDIDLLTNPLWNGKETSLFGIFEQVTDNALSKFKKRFSSF